MRNLLALAVLAALAAAPGGADPADPELPVMPNKTEFIAMMRRKLAEKHPGLSGPSLERELHLLASHVSRRVKSGAVVSPHVALNEVYVPTGVPTGDAIKSIWVRKDKSEELGRLLPSQAEDVHRQALAVQAQAWKLPPGVEISPDAKPVAVSSVVYQMNVLERAVALNPQPGSAKTTSLRRP